MARKWGHTQVNLDKCVYTWTIGHFSYLQKQLGQNLDSPSFRLGNDEWCLRLYPAGINDSYTDHASLYLHRKPAGEGLYPSRYGQLVLAVLDRQGTAIVEKSFSCRYEGVLRTCGISDFIERVSLIDDKLLVDDTLALRCELGLVNNLVNVSSEDGDAESSSEPSVNESLHRARTVLSEHMETLFENRVPSSPGDVRLVVKDCGRELTAHKCVLAARSPVFAAMFAHEMMENKLNTVIIEELEYEVLRKLLRYMYAARVDDVDEASASELLAAADKYEVEGLKELCGQMLWEKISLNNVCEILVLADSHGVKKLKERATGYAMARIQEVVKTEGFQKIIPSNVVADLLREALVK